AEASAPARGVGPVPAGVVPPRRLQRLDPFRRPAAQLVERAELDGLRRARLGAGRVETTLQAVVAHGALPCQTFVLPPVVDPEGARRHAVAAPVADVLLHYDRPELRPEQRPRGTHFEPG